MFWCNNQIHDILTFDFAVACAKYWQNKELLVGSWDFPVESGSKTIQKSTIRSISHHPQQDLENLQNQKLFCQAVQKRQERKEIKRNNDFFTGYHLPIYQVWFAMILYMVCCCELWLLLLTGTITDCMVYLVVSANKMLMPVFAV